MTTPGITKNIRYMLFDGEYLTSLHIKQLLATLRPHYILVGESQTTIGAQEILCSTSINNVDLIITDLQLADGMSLDTLVQYAHNTSMIIYTSWNNYRNRVKNLNVIDFVLKPISESDLAGSISRFEQNMKITK